MEKLGGNQHPQVLQLMAVTAVFMAAVVVLMVVAAHRVW
jgi:hypothetical protein